ncbi:MAG TPA: hypothetical protein VKI19_06035 [Acidimicrobiales bacterium]|nr:hypothetical protein [Acidimicrobiales bacterium]
MPSSSLRWVDRSQPQTLMTATILLYINAVFGLIYGQLWATYYGFPLGAVLVLGQAGAGLGIANEKKWGYWLGVGLVAVWIAFLVHYFHFVSIINLLFYVALLALLLHPMSRSYRKVWFR